MDDKQQRLNQIIDWVLMRLPIIPLVMSVAFLYIFQESHLAWAYRWLQVSFGIFLMMPGWLLLFRPNITIATVNAVYAFLFSRRSNTIAPLIKQDWQHINNGTKALLVAVCVTSFLAGARVLEQGFSFPGSDDASSTGLPH